MPASRWSEWISCAPLLMYLTLSTDYKHNFSRRDYISIYSFGSSMFFGLLVNIKQPLWSASILLILSTLLWLVALFQHRDIQRDYDGVHVESTSDTVNSKNISTSNAAKKRILNVKRKKLHLMFILTSLTPTFVIIYFLRLFRVINHDVTQAGYLICDICTKLLFTSYAVDAHIEMMHPSTSALIEEQRQNEARKTFSRFVFHEVRVPLNSITMGIHLISKNPSLDSEHLETVAMMREASSFMGSTLNDVLSLQKMEEGKLDLKLAPFAFKDLVNTVVMSLQGQIRDKEVHMTVHIGDDVPRVVGDRFKLEHVLANLLSNAIKFLPHGGNITIDVLLLHRSPSSSIDPGGRRLCEVEVSVTDDGPGMSAEDQKNLFTPFMQIRPEQMQHGKGSGLGLSICKQIVTLHGGVIRCQSAAGEGSRFSFRIPFPRYINEEIFHSKDCCKDKLCSIAEEPLSSMTGGGILSLEADALSVDNRRSVSRSSASSSLPEQFLTQSVIKTASLLKASANAACKNQSTIHCAHDVLDLNNIESEISSTFVSNTESPYVVPEELLSGGSSNTKIMSIGNGSSTTSNHYSALSTIPKVLNEEWDRTSYQPPRCKSLYCLVVDGGCN